MHSPPSRPLHGCFSLPRTSSGTSATLRFSDSNTAEHLIYQLAGDPTDEHIRECHAALSAEQRASIVAFLGFVQPRLEGAGDAVLADFAKRGIAYWSRAAV